MKNPDARYKHFIAWVSYTDNSRVMIACTRKQISDRASHHEWLTIDVQLITCPECLTIAKAEEVLVYAQNRRS